MLMSTAFHTTHELLSMISSFGEILSEITYIVDNKYIKILYYT